MDPRDLYGDMYLETAMDIMPIVARALEGLPPCVPCMGRDFNGECANHIEHEPLLDRVFLPPRKWISKKLGRGENGTLALREALDFAMCSKCSHDRFADDRVPLYEAIATIVGNAIREVGETRAQERRKQWQQKMLEKTQEKNPAQPQEGISGHDAAPQTEKPKAATELRVIEGGRQEDVPATPATPDADAEAGRSGNDV